MRPYRFHPEAEAEADTAFEYYWTKSPAAAFHFDAEMRIALSSVRENPRLYAQYIHGTRRTLLGRFPYFIVYRELPRKTEIIAVAHAKRRPGYWKKRLKQ